MADLYNTVMRLCEESGISGYRLCKDAGIQPSVLTDLKMGRTNSLSAKNLGKIANYFHIPIDYLIEMPSTLDRDTIGSVANSVVLQGNRGNNTVSNGSAAKEAAITDQEAEVLRIFRSLDMRKKTAVLSYLYDMEDGGN